MCRSNVFGAPSFLILCNENSTKYGVPYVSTALVTSSTKLHHPSMGMHQRRAVTMKISVLTLLGYGVNVRKHCKPSASIGVATYRH